MAQEDEYTAIGPAQSDSGMPFAAFSSRATGMEYGANLQGDRAGIYAESVNGPTTRVPQFGKAGVYGVGDNFGVVGETTSIGAGAEVAGSPGPGVSSAPAGPPSRRRARRTRSGRPTDRPLWPAPV